MLGYIISGKEAINVEEHKIQSFNILHKTELNIFVVENNKVLYRNDIINNVCRYGHVQVLEWFKNSGYEFKYSEFAINCASHNGYVRILEWFKNSGYKFKYDEWAINYASEHGLVETLNWFKNSGYKFKYDKWALIDIEYNHYKVLKFFENRNVKKVIKWTKFKYSKPLNFNKTLKYKTIKYKTKNNYIKGYNKN